MAADIADNQGNAWKMAGAEKNTQYPPEEWGKQCNPETLPCRNGQFWKKGFKHGLIFSRQYQPLTFQELGDLFFREESLMTEELLSRII